MLYDITTELAQDLGRDLNNPKDRAWLINQINHAAREFYFTDTIQGCEREQIFILGTTDQQIALPWYSESIIAARNYETRDDIQQVDMRPRYSRSGWKKPYQQYPYCQWRQKGDRALSQNLSAEAPLTLTLPDGVDAVEAFVVYVAGSNSQSARVVEQVAFAVGDHTKTTTNFFDDVMSIEKSIATTYDLNVTEVSGATVSSIPSHLKIARFNLVQILDRGETQSQAQLVEILFKARFEPYVRDTDVFTAGGVYEKCIYWKTLEQIYAKEDGKEDKAAMCGNKGQALLNNILSSLSDDIEMEVQFGRNPTIEAFRQTRWCSYNGLLGGGGVNGGYWSGYY